MEIIDSVLGDYEYWQLSRELNLLDITDDVLYRPFFTLSNGEQTKVLLAALFLKENSFLLIDEPTNHLDMAARKIVSDYLSKKRGFILVSHDRTFLDNCVDHILSINKTDIQIQSGNFSSWWHNKALQDSYEMSENEKLKSEIKHLEEAAARTAKWSDKVEKTKNGTKLSGLKPDKGYIGHKAAKMMKQSKNLEKRQQSNIEEKSRLLKNVENSETLKISNLKHHCQRLAELEKVSLFYGENIVCKEISFTISQGERIAIYGRNGSGKSSIIKLICTDLQSKRDSLPHSSLSATEQASALPYQIAQTPLSYTGIVKKAQGIKISYVSQDTAHLCGNLTEYAKEKGINESLFKTILRKLDFSRVQFEKDMKDFSGGQKKKVLIAGSLCEKAHLYIWDEPLNFIDVISRMQIENLLKQYAPTILFVEHDRAFCENIATKIINL